ncbi:LysR substrate-binding domain-containing protein [Paraburkholderia sp. FT54]|uniref:LysR family transcriptional regulator n=1 Tax=Paraburkholderia sp. FT54 TaxID=3074437 RepID=UPI00287758B6|nr:LysR family transcriptional regulator [Paraburkholderia sp. FT54]WNC94608.1 LysR substrate-binding domain-containing protein [Paraburkholderia sp. FT54]
MELKWLEDFLTLAATRNFSRTAELRFMTQPAFSRRVKMLEEWVGVTLLDRHAQPIALTAAGERFRDIAEEVARQLYQGRDELRAAAEGLANTVKFVATHSLSLTFFPHWISASERPGEVLKFRLDTGHATACVQMMLQGASHFMLCHTHPSIDIGLDPKQFLAYRIGFDRLLPLSRPGVGSGPLDSLDDASSGRCRYLAYAETSAIGRAVEKLLRTSPAAGRLDRVFVSPLAGVLNSMVRDGRGLAWLPQSQVGRELESGELVRAGSSDWDIEVDITLFRPRARLPGSAEAFWETLTATSSAQAVRPAAG